MEDELVHNTEILALPPTPIRVETATSRYPIHRLARKGSIKIDINASDLHKDTSLQWKVSYNSEYGQPGPQAYKVDTLIVNRRIEESTRPIPRLIRLGSLHDMCKELGLSEGKNKSSIKQALFQNASAFITAKICYRGADGSERTLEAAFTRYSVIMTGEKMPNGRKADAVYIILNDVYMQVLNGATTRPLDYDYLKSLPPASQRFYELLSYQMYAALKHDRPRAKLTYSEFCSHAPQTRHVEWENVRSQMNKIHRPHKASGYIAKVDFQQIADNNGDPDWLMLYMPGPKARQEYRTFTKRGGPVHLEVESAELRDAGGERSELERELIRRGISEEAAAGLVRDHAEEKIRLQIEILDWRLNRKTGHPIDDAAAYLVAAIKSGADGHALPKGFISAAERERRQLAKQAKEREAAEERRRKEQALQADHAKRRRDDAYWEALTPDQQAELDAASIAAADAEMLDLEKGPLKKTFQNNRRHAYIRQLLDEREAGSEKEAIQAI